LLDDINDSDANENDEDDENNDLSPMLVESEEAEYTC
jgi:hypothetical protein